MRQRRTTKYTKYTKGRAAPDAAKRRLPCFDRPRKDAEDRGNRSFTFRVFPRASAVPPLLKKERPLRGPGRRPSRVFVYFVVPDHRRRGSLRLALTRKQ